MNRYYKKRLEEIHSTSRCAVRFTYYSNTSNNTENTKDTLYLHISPSGDWWTGPEIFAAKHLQPDYVKSIPLPSNFDPEKYFGEDNDNIELLHQIYDEGALPQHMFDKSRIKVDKK